MKKFFALSLLIAGLAVFPAACSEMPAFPPQAQEWETLPADPLPPEETQTLPPVPEETPPPEESEAPAVHYLAVTATALNVRAGAGTHSCVLGTAERGELFLPVARQGDWWETRYQNGRAYLHAAYVTDVALPKEDEATERVIAEGFQLLGTPYVYGATRLHDGRGHLLSGFTAAKFDCSSLMQYVFYRGADVLLDVTTRTQVKQGEEAKEWKRGDLLFFTNVARKNNTGIERVGHVALYLGGGYILHTASDYAKAEKLTEGRRSYYICARRMTGTVDKGD